LVFYGHGYARVISITVGWVIVVRLCELALWQKL